MKLFIKISVYILIFVGVVLTVFPKRWFPSFYDVRYMGWSAFVSAVAIIILPRVLRVSAHTPDSERKNHAAHLFQFALTVAIMSNALGDLGLYQLYKVGFEFDKLIHLSTSTLGAIAIPVILNKRFKISISYSITIAFVAIILLGISWELYEYFVDNLLETHIYGVYGSDIGNDTKFDLIFDVIGAVSGTLASFYMIYKNGQATFTSGFEEYTKE